MKQSNFKTESPKRFCTNAESAQWRALGLKIWPKGVTITPSIPSEASEAWPGGYQVTIAPMTPALVSLG